MRQSIIVSIFSFIVAMVLGVLYWILRYGFLDNSFFIVLKVLGVSAFVLMLPVGFSYLQKPFTESVNRVFFNDNIVSLAGLILISVLGYLCSIFKINISIAFIVIGYLLLFLSLYLFLRDGYLWGKVILVTVASFLAVWAGSVCWGVDFLNPYVLESWATAGTGKVDTQFHIAIAQMIKTYGAPGTGLDGTPFINYHWGSHWLFAQLSYFLDLPVIVIYQLCFPVIIVPLFFRSILSFILEIKYSTIEIEKFNFFFWIIFLAIFIGLFKSAWAGNSWVLYSASGTGLPVFMLSSESYTLSICLMFALFSHAFNFWKHKEQLTSAQQTIAIFFVVPVFMAVIGITKISTLYVICCLSGYFFLRLKMFRSKMPTAGMLFLIMISLATGKLVFETGVDHGAFSLFYFFNNRQVSFPTFLLLVYIWTYIFIGAFIVQQKLSKQSFWHLFRSNNLLPLECVLCASVAGLLPAIFLKIQNYDVFYFAEIQLWISATFLLAYIPFHHVIQSNSRLIFVLKSLIVVYLLAIFAINTKAHVGIILGESRKHHILLAELPHDIRYRNIIKAYSADKNQLNVWYVKNKSLTFYLKLKELDKLPLDVKKRTLIYVDLRSMYQQKDYGWKLYCYNLPFVIPALTGMAMIDGIDITYFEMCGGCCEQYGFGYQFFPKWKTREQIDKPVSVSDLCIRVKKAGFENLILYNPVTQLFEKIECR